MAIRFDSRKQIHTHTLTRKRLLQQTVVLRHAEERSRIFKNVHTHNIAFTFSLLLHNHTPKQSHTLYLSLFLTHLGTQTHVHSLFLNICLKPSVLFLSLSLWLAQTKVLASTKTCIPCKWVPNTGDKSLSPALTSAATVHSFVRLWQYTTQRPKYLLCTSPKKMR